MTDAVNPKLLVVLGLAIVVAGVGAVRLLTAEDLTLDNGFEPTTELPIVVAPTPEAPEPGIDSVADTLSDPAADIGRNPFVRADGGVALVPTDEDTSADEAPVFPNPDLVDQEPLREDSTENSTLDR